MKSQVEKSAREHKTEKFKQEVIEHKARNKILENHVKTLYESKNKARKELMDAKKEFKKEAWRKDLGEETKQNIRLEIKQ